jgi:hypothetical protein
MRRTVPGFQCMPELSAMDEDSARPAWFETPASRAPHHEGLLWCQALYPHPEERPS